MKRQWIAGSVIVLLIIGAVWFLKSRVREKPVEVKPGIPSISQAPLQPVTPTAGERLLEGYGDEGTPPIEDLRKIHRVLGGYFSVIKDSSRFPIGGNEDLAAALRGENQNKEVFVPAGHRLFAADGKIIDRWGTALIVHPEGWQRIELRSAGPDRKPYTEDDLVILPTGMQAPR